MLDEDEEDMLENINMADYDRDEGEPRRRRLQGRCTYHITHTSLKMTHSHSLNTHITSPTKTHRYTGTEDDEDVSMRRKRT